MLGNATTFQSDTEEIEYLYELTGVEPEISYDTFDAQLAEDHKCIYLLFNCFLPQSKKYP